MGGSSDGKEQREKRAVRMHDAGLRALDGMSSREPGREADRYVPGWSYVWGGRDGIRYAGGADAFDRQS